MLLDENPLIELTDDDATNLVRLLFASVRKAVGERIVPASDNRKQFYNKAQKVTPQLIASLSYLLVLSFAHRCKGMGVMFNVGGCSYKKNLCILNLVAHHTITF